MTKPRSSSGLVWCRTCRHRHRIRSRWDFWSNHTNAEVRCPKRGYLVPMRAPKGKGWVPV